MMNGPEKSDPCVLAMKSMNKLGRLAKGNEPVLNMCRTKSRESMLQQPMCPFDHRDRPVLADSSEGAFDPERTPVTHLTLRR